jgi:hypothetical protein
MAKTVIPRIVPVTKRRALAGKIDCKTTAANAPIVMIITTTGNPTTKKETVRVKVQSRKLLTIPIT